jgi:hypothetical protein
LTGISPSIGRCWIDVDEDDLDEAQMARWVKQAATIPGWIGS